MGHWEQFPIGNDEQSESNAPPLKRLKTSDGSSNPQINPPGKIFFKTRLCAKFRMGLCRNGENCNFAHGEDDMRQPPPNWQDLVSGRTDDRASNCGNWEDEDNIVHRMKLCKKFYNGEECPYGERCNFLHKEQPNHRDSSNLVLARFRESSAISIGINGMDQFDLKTVYWKTRMCTKWEVTGHCPFGEKCHFAHGISDLQMGGEQELMNQSSTGVKTVIVSVGRTQNQEEEQRRKCLMKWNRGKKKKINSIYADWIDDMPLNMPNEVEV